MARSYTAFEGRGKTSQTWRGWERAKDLETAIRMAGKSVKAYEEDIQKDPTDPYLRTSRGNAQETLDLLRNIKRYIAKYDAVKAGDLSVFEPPVTKRSEDESVTGQIALYEMAKKDGISLGDVKNVAKDADEFWAKYGDGQRRETQVTLDAEGRRISAITGTDEAIDLPVWRVAREVVRGGQSWHNHPVNDGRVWGFTFSKGDIDHLFEWGLRTTTVSTKEGTYTLTINDKAWKEINEGTEWARDLISRAGKAWNSQWQIQANQVANIHKIKNSGDLFRNEKAATELLKYSNALFAANAPSLGMRYTFTPRPEYAGILKAVDSDTAKPEDLMSL